MGRSYNPSGESRAHSSSVVTRADSSSLAKCVGIRASEHVFPRLTRTLVAASQAPPSFGRDYSFVPAGTPEGFSAGTSGHFALFRVVRQYWSPHQASVSVLMDAAFVASGVVGVG